MGWVLKNFTFFPKQEKKSTKKPPTALSLDIQKLCLGLVRAVFFIRLMEDKNICWVVF